MLHVTNKGKNYFISNYSIDRIHVNVLHVNAQNVWWHTVSNAFFRSRKNIPVYCLLPILSKVDVMMSSCHLVRLHEYE